MMRNILNSGSNETTNNTNTNETKTVNSNDNHVYFYSDVDGDKCLTLYKEILAIDKNLMTERYARDLEYAPNCGVPIWLHIQSGGGTVLSALALADQLKRIKSPVFSVIEGICGSAATFISISCNKRFITQNSFVLIHQITGMMYGNYSELKDYMHMEDMVMESLVNLYLKNTKIVNRDKVLEFLSKDSWLNSQEALEIGIVDEIL
jgi:ATP-dependent Clp protease, protease subunit